MTISPPEMAKMFDVRFELDNLKFWSINLSANLFNYNLSYNHSEKKSAGQDISLDSIRFGLDTQDFRTELKNTYASSKSTKYSGLELAVFGEPVSYNFGDEIAVDYKPYNFGISYNWVNFNSTKSEGYGVDFSFENEDNKIMGSYYKNDNNTGYTVALDLENGEIIYGNSNNNLFNSENIYLETFIDKVAIGYHNDDSSFNGNKVENQAISLGYNIIDFTSKLDIKDIDLFEDDELFVGLKYNF